MLIIPMQWPGKSTLRNCLDLNDVLYTMKATYTQVYSGQSIDKFCKMTTQLFVMEILIQFSLTPPLGGNNVI